MTRRSADGARAVPGVPVTLAAGVLGATVGAGYLAVRFSLPLVHNRDLPWIAGRTFGIAAYGALLAMVVVGLWLRHPWRAHWAALHPEALLRLHAALGAAVLVLLAGHVASLALDRYAGVGWRGVLVPGAAVYRPVPVGVGVCAAYGLLLVAATAGVAGRVVGRAWRPVHLLALPVFAAVWCHGVLAGSDGARLRVLYAASGLVVLVLVLTRLFGHSRVSTLETGHGAAGGGVLRGGRGQ